MAHQTPEGDTGAGQVRVLRLLPLFLAGGFVFAVTERTQIYLSDLYGDRSHGYLWGLLRIQPPWLILAGLAPLVIWFALRCQIVRPHRLRALLVHFGASIVFAYAHFALLALIHYAVLHDADSFGNQLMFLTGIYLVQDLFVYWTVVGATHAWLFREALRRREIDAAELRLRLSEARVDALKRQIRPHFLYNTLNTVSMLAREGNSDAVVEVVADLSGLLRYSLRESPDEVELREELEVLRRYVAIEQRRFGDRLVVTWDIAPRTESALVPGLILQPLVENAIRHGLSHRPAVAELGITSRELNRSLVIEVQDNGPGLSGGTGSGTGIGLRNVEARLAGLYGTAARLELGSPARGGTVARLVLPVRDAPAPTRTPMQSGSIVGGGGP